MLFISKIGPKNIMISRFRRGKNEFDGKKLFHLVKVSRRILIVTDY